MERKVLARELLGVISRIAAVIATATNTMGRDRAASSLP